MNLFWVWKRWVNFPIFSHSWFVSGPETSSLIKQFVWKVQILSWWDIKWPSFLRQYFYLISLTAAIGFAAGWPFAFRKLWMTWSRICIHMTCKEKYKVIRFAYLSAYLKVLSGVSHTPHSSFCSFFLPHIMNQ